MKTTLTSQHFAAYLQEALERYRGDAALEFNLDNSEVMMNEDVMELLKISERTLRNYRKKNYLQFIKLEGRCYYLRPVLLMNLLSHCERNNERE